MLIALHKDARTTPAIRAEMAASSASASSLAKQFGISESATRSGLDRCLRRHAFGNLNALKPQMPQEPHNAFKSYEPGFVHIDVEHLPQMQDKSSRRYLFVAIDRATRWLFVQINSHKTAAAAAQAFLKALHRACPFKIQKILTDNGKDFSDRLFAPP